MAKGAILYSGLSFLSFHPSAYPQFGFSSELTWLRILNMAMKVQKPDYSAVTDLDFRLYVLTIFNLFAS